MNEKQIADMAKAMAEKVAKNASVVPELCFPHIYLGLMDHFKPGAAQPVAGELPPLPEPWITDQKYAIGSFSRNHYAEDQMRNYGRVCRGWIAQPVQQPAAFPERDHSKPAEQQGVFRKFDVRRVDGSDDPGGKHHGCRYFVLDMDHDQHAGPALEAYAASCASTHPALSAELASEFGQQPAAVSDEPPYEFVRYSLDYIANSEKPLADGDIAALIKRGWAGYEGGIWRAAATVVPAAGVQGDSDLPNKAFYWFECLAKCAKALNLADKTPIPSGVVAAVESLVTVQGDITRYRLHENCPGAVSHKDGEFVKYSDHIAKQQPDSGRDAALVRERFETWARSDFNIERADGTNYRIPKGSYLSDATTQAWHVWKSALAAHPAPSSDAALVEIDARARNAVTEALGIPRTERWDHVLDAVREAAICKWAAPAKPDGWTIERVGDAMHVKRGSGGWVGFMPENGPRDAFMHEFLSSIAAHPANGAQACDCDDGMRWVDGCTQPCEKCQNVTDDSAANGAQAVADKLDAERYRWLRNQDIYDELGSTSPYVVAGQSVHMLEGAEVDKAVDAAILAAAKKAAQ